MKPARTFLMALFLLISGASYGQLVEWAEAAHMANNYHSHMVNAVSSLPTRPYAATDAAGNTYLVGNTQDSICFGSHKLYADGNALPPPMQLYGDNIAYMAKLDPSGFCLWLKPIAATPNALLTVSSIDLDAAGNVYVCGMHCNEAVFGCGIYPTGAFHRKHAYWAKFDPDGNCLKVVTASSFPVFHPQYSFGDSFGLAVKVDKATGEVYLLTAFQQLIIFGADTLIGDYFSNMSENQVGIHCFSPSGTINWTRKFSANLGLDVKSFELSAAGDVFLAGNGRGLFRAETQAVTQVAPSSWMLKYTRTGQLGWLKLFVGTTLSSAYLKPLSSGHTYLAGSFRTSMTLGSHTLSVPADVVGAFHARFNPAGDCLWLKGMPGNMLTWGFVTGIEADLQGNVYLAGGVGGTGALPPPYTLTFGNHTVACTDTGSMDIFMAKSDSAGNWQWAQRLGGHGLEHVGTMCLAPDGSLRLFGYFGGKDAEFGAFHLASQLKPPYFYGCNLFVVKVRPDANLITGLVSKDYNNNGMRDSGEPVFPEVIVEMLPGPQYFTSHTSRGTYTAICDTGSYSLSLPHLPLYHRQSSPNLQVQFTGGLNQVDTANHFSVHPLPGRQDLRLFLVEAVNNVPGPAETYHLFLQNIGTTTMSGSFWLQLDTLFTYVSSPTPPASHSGQLLRWNYSNLQPGETRYHPTRLRISSLAAHGTRAGIKAGIDPLAGDLNPADNTDTVAVEIYVPWPDNTFRVGPPRDITPAQIANDLYLNYTLHFRNLTADTAQTVTIIDTLSASLDIPTFEFLGSSHPVQWSMSGPGRVEFRFANINLPDSASSESHGFLSFRVRPKHTLVVGDQVRNSAYVAFDGGVPLLTNTTVTTVAVPLATAQQQISRGFTVFPNPGSGLLRVSYRGEGREPLQLQLRNVLGQVVCEQQERAATGSGQYTLDARHLAKGVYMLHLQQGTFTATRRVVVQP